MRGKYFMTLSNLYIYIYICVCVCVMFYVDVRFIYHVKTSTNEMTVTTIINVSGEHMDTAHTDITMAAAALIEFGPKTTGFIFFVIVCYVTNYRRFRESLISRKCDRK